MEQLKIGQPLTPEQVRSLPDGAEVHLVTGMGVSVDWIALPSYTPRVKIAMDLAGGYYRSATLASLPTTEPQAVGIDYGTGDKTAVFVSEPRPVSEIEREAALYALTALMDDCHDVMTDAMAERDYEYLHDFMTAVDSTFNRYRKFYQHARSIGAIE